MWDYDTNGYLDEVVGPNNLKYWKATDQNARGQLARFNMANGTNTHHIYDQVNGCYNVITKVDP